MIARDRVICLVKSGAKRGSPITAKVIMEMEIKIAWSTQKSPDFDLREFVSGVLEIAKENLQRDGELAGIAFVITDDQIQCAAMEFAEHDEKTAMYNALTRFAQTEHATALVTCNDAFMSNDAGPDAAETYYPGKLAAEGARECIMLTVSGPGIRTWCLEVPYERERNEIRFGDVVEESGGQLGLLEGWASVESKVH